MKKSDIIARVLSTIDANTEKPEKFLGVQDDVELELRKNLKILYDFTREKTIEHTIINNSNNCDYTLPKLVIEDVDQENIWQQLELQNESVIQNLIVEICNITAKNNLLKLSGTKQRNNVNDDDEHDNNKEENISHCDENPSDDNEPLDSNNQIEIKLPNNEKTKTSKRKRVKNKPSIVDDKFFKLSELDKFLNHEDKKEFTKKSDSNSDHDSDEEFIDLFNNYPSEDEDDDDDDAKDIKYADFFDSPESEDDDNDSTQNKITSNDGNDSDNSNDSIDDCNEDVEDENHFKSEKRKITKKVDGKNKRVKFSMDANTDDDDDDDD
ncbi:GSCOCG00009369001-RA-CDS, partial [Cotesia congregata]